MFVSRVILSLPNDFKQLGEFKARTRINFAACRGVFGHSFINNWVNGVLYHFPFRNVRFFTSPLDPVKPNSPYNEYCRDTIVLHDQTTNFYYRSSPYSTSNFVGMSRSGRRKRNEKENQSLVLSKKSLQSRENVIYKPFLVLLMEECLAIFLVYACDSSSSFVPLGIC